MVPNSPTQGGASAAMSTSHPGGFLLETKLTFLVIQSNKHTLNLGDGEASLYLFFLDSGPA